MSDNRKSARSARHWPLYAMIPLGFIVLVLVLIFSGFWRQDPEGTTETEIVDEPPAPLGE